MTTKEYHDKKYNIAVAKDMQEFKQRLKINSWDKPETEWNLRLKALIQFHPNHSTRQILNRAQL